MVPRDFAFSPAVGLPALLFILENTVILYAMHFLCACPREGAGDTENERWTLAFWEGEAQAKKEPRKRYILLSLTVYISNMLMVFVQFLIDIM